MLDVNDVRQTRGGMEVRLNRRASGEKRYITLPPNDDQQLCPVAAMSAWRKYLTSVSHNNTGPLFVQMDSEGQLPIRAARLTNQAVATIITNAVNYSISSSRRHSQIRIKSTSLIPELLTRVPD